MFLGTTALKRYRPTSGASRNKQTINLTSITHNKLNKLSSRVKNSSGRTASGRVSVFSKGKRNMKSRFVSVNKSFRDTSISFISGFAVSAFTSSLRSIVYTSSGTVSYIPSTDQHFLFKLTHLLSLNNFRSELFNSVILLKRYLKLSHSFFIIKRLPKNQPVSNLEILPAKGVQYCQSPGTKSIITKMDTRTGSALVRLPSGVKKVFSIYSIGSLGYSALKEKKANNVTSAGSRVIKGYKPQTRGVAKNPVDHPHGGRTKSIKYPRTP